MEKYLGRKLTRKEAVHHINDIKDDNRIENLQVMTIGEHIALHNRKRIYRKGYKLNLTSKERLNRSEQMKKNRRNRVKNEVPTFTKRELLTPAH